MKLLKIALLLSLLAHNSAQAQSLDDSESYWRNQIVRYCGDAPSKENCDDGDSIIFNGLLCMSGEEAACTAVQAAQDSEGQFWRSPRRNPGNLGENNSFSRDQALGALLYIAKKRDVDAAQRWLDWINNNKTCSIKNPFKPKACILHLYRVCRDDDDGRCTMTPATWAMFKRVWDYLGLPTHNEMDKNETLDVSDLEIAALDRQPRGYTLHLEAAATFLRLTMQSSVERSQIMASKLYNKDPGNPFFQILAQGPSDSITDKVLGYCPKPGQNTDFRRFQWSWERDSDQQPWLESMGWDCVFMANLIRNYHSIIP